jgi:REP element-mobilizing transposase RayT
MSRKYKFHDQTKPYFVTLGVVGWIDLFTRSKYKDILLDSLSYCQQHKGLEVYAWCIMTSHVHLIIGTRANPMEDIMRDFKSFTSHQLRLAIIENVQESRKEWMLDLMYKTGINNNNNRGFQLWQQHNHPVELDTNEIMDQRLDYLHNNPVEAGIVFNPEDYVYSSARDYAGEKGFLNINLLV